MQLILATLFNEVPLGVIMYWKDIEFYLQYQTLNETKRKADENIISSLIIFQIIFLIIVLERLSLAVLQILMRKHEYEVEI